MGISLFGGRLSALVLQFGMDVPVELQSPSTVLQY